MSKTLAQIFAINPTTVVADTDLYYLVQSPYTPGTDAAITGASLKAAFGTGGMINPGLVNQLGYYAASGSDISGLATLANGTLITSAGGVPSISQTLPSTVQGNITSLGTISSGAWNGSVISGTYGGTGVNNGASTITIGGNFAMSGAFAFTGTLTGITGVTFPTSGTLATTAQLLVSPLTTKGDLWGYSTTNDRLAVGSTNGQVLQVASGAATGLAYSTATYPSTALSAARILRSDGTNYVDTTSTFADTYTASSILYANGANNVAGLTTANNGTLVTGATGIPSILVGPGTTGNFLQSNAAAAPSWSASTITLGGNFTMSGGFTFTGTVTGNTSVTFPTSGTLATTSQIPSLPLSLTNGGTAASLAASNGGIVYSNASTLAILAGTATAGLALLSGASTTPSWSSSPPITRVIRQVFTGNGTYTRTTGCVYADIECLGGGAAGGGAASSAGQSGAGGGGGAGGYSKIVATAATIGASQTVTIGAGGTAGTAGNNPGGNGGDTSVGTICVGKGGTGGSGAPTTGSGTGGAGGVAGTGDMTSTGAPGFTGMGTTVVTIFVVSGQGASSLYGGGGRGYATSASTAGNAATNYGSGGSGGVSWNGGTSQAGGAGSAGIVIITEYVSV